MAQDKSSMFSDAAYLFGKSFSSLAPSRGEDQEELPDGTKVSQRKLAELLVLAALAYLYQKKLIDFTLEEGRFLFRKTSKAIVKKLQATAPDTRGLEAAIFTSFQDTIDLYNLTQLVIPGLSADDPWDEVLQIVKTNLLERGILQQVKAGKVLFITRYKYVVNGDISNEEQQATELKKTLAELQSQAELYERMLSAVKDGIASQEKIEVDDTDDDDTDDDE